MCDQKFNQSAASCKKQTVNSVLFEVYAKADAIAIILCCLVRLCCYAAAVVVLAATVCALRRAAQETMAEGRAPGDKQLNSSRQRQL